LKRCRDKLLLIQVVIEFLRGLGKPILTNNDLDMLGDVSVSAAVDRAHMGLMTGLADLVGQVLYPA
jgi:hypothetical protein